MTNVRGIYKQCSSHIDRGTKQRTPVAGAAFLVNIDHALKLVRAAVERAHLPGEVEGGPLVAVGRQAALVLDVNHAVHLMRAAEDAALLPREVEVGHAAAPLCLALAILRAQPPTKFSTHDGIQ